ncbi:MAG: LysM peptidoglycan-binding domain-containing protein [Chloroflexota bacterium]
MHHHLMRRLWLTGWIIVLFLAAGCFQPAGGGLEATSVAQALPTFTPYPTDTPSPIPLPTDVPTDILIPTDTATFEIIEPSTQVALLPDNQDLDPIWQTATAVYLLSQGQQPINIQPLDVPTLDPLLQQATDMVRQATETAAMPMTLTAIAIQGGPTAPPIFIQPTVGPSVPIVIGNDCIYEVQPTDVNLYRISLLFGIPYLSIAASTHMVNPNLIHVGDKLIIPGCGTTGYQPPPTTIPTNDPGYFTPNPGGGSGQTYIVVQGDTLFALSLSWGTTVNAIAALNQIPNINLIYIGQTLYIP